jgi:peptide deformylase
MSEVFRLDTAEAAKVEIKKEQPRLLNLVSEEHPILKQVLPEFDFKNSPINPEKLASDLAETCKANHGIGLSANQCGLPYRVFVMGSEDGYVAYFNPSIVLKSKKEIHMMEGCLSFPFLGLRITRPEEVAVTYQDHNGDWKEAQFSGISARCFQHELDHLNGIVYTSHAKQMALQSGMAKRNKILKKLRLR